MAAAILLVPDIRSAKRERAELERRQERRYRAAERRRLSAEQRPRRGRLAAAGTSEMLPRLEALIAADARRRVAAGELPTRVRRGDCEPLDSTARSVRLSCLAVTSDIPPGAVTRGGRIGYPYRARVELRSGRYAFCKTGGRPGEGALGTGIWVPVPRACGG